MSASTEPKNQSSLLRPTFTNILPRYGLAQQIKIKKSNLSSSATTTDTNSTSTKPFHTQHRPPRNSGLFQDFEYAPTGYGLDQAQKRQERKDSIQKFQALCRVRFAGPNGGMGRKPKYEDCFGGVCANVYNYGSQANLSPKGPDSESTSSSSGQHGRKPSHVIRNGERQATSNQQDHDNNHSLRPFIPAGGGLVAEVDQYHQKALSRKSLSDIITKLYSVLRTDWPEADFSLGANMDDFVILAWNLSSIDNTNALVSYMNLVIDSAPVCRQYLLSKLHDRWGIERCIQKDGKRGVLFVLRPAWVKSNTLCVI